MNKKTKLLSILGLVTAILFLFSSEVLAQSLSISGKVIDKNSQEPVIGASSFQRKFSCVLLWLCYTNSSY